MNIVKYTMEDREGNIKIAAFLNISFAVVEVVVGFLTNSLAILSNALHDFGDSLVFIFAWILERISKKPADKKRTFGYQRLSLFASFFAAIVLITGSMFVLFNAIPRLIKPEYVKAEGMIFMAVLGLIVNGIGFFRLKNGHSQNEKILSWHLLGDILGWVVIFIGGIIIKFWHNYLIDPIITIGFTCFVLYGVFRNLREGFNIFLEGIPEHVDAEKIKQLVLAIDGVKGIYDVHVWSLEGETSILTARVFIEDALLAKSSEIRNLIKEILEKNNIHHSTIEIEIEKFCVGQECCFESSRKVIMENKAVNTK